MIMRKLNFLIIGKHTQILLTLKRLIEQNEGWTASVLEDEDQFQSFMNRISVDVILLSSGLSELTEVGIQAYALSVNSNIKVIQHYGGGSGLLKNEIFTLFPDLIGN